VFISAKYRKTIKIYGAIVDINYGFFITHPHNMCDNFTRQYICVKKSHILYIKKSHIFV